MNRARVRPRVLILLSAALALGGCDRGKGVIRGTVLLQGTPPPERKIIFDPASAQLQTTNHVTTRHYVVGTNGGLGNVLVHVKADVSKLPPIERTNSAALAIRKAVYEPYVCAVRTNQPLQLRNEDPVGHTAAIMPPAGNPNPSRSLALPPQYASINLTFPTNTFTVATPPLGWRERVLRWLKLKRAPARTVPSPFIRLKCDVHPWEYGYVAVLDHPYFAVTGPDGRFDLPPLPAGQYTVEAIHLKAGTNSQRVTVSPEGKQITLVMTVPQPATTMPGPAR